MDQKAALDVGWLKTCIGGVILANWLTVSALSNALLIFFLRVADMSLDTLRVLFVMRGRKGIAWIFGFFQSAIFLLAFANVLSNISNPFSFLGYAGGFATGNVVGIWIEGKLAIGYTHLRIMSTGYGNKIADTLREQGYAVTELPGRGMNGMVTILNCSVLRKNTSRASQLVQEIDPNAFITAQEVSAIQRGYWRA
ncbi:MAG: DUF5698 domain-containing protein [Anaerolineales bacterium]|nr:DUF5698 domain-containing protein [Anaerolineales bacterium]